MSKQKFAYAATGYTCFLLALSNILFWIYLASDSRKSFTEAKSDYLSFFPPVIANATMLTLICIALFAVAIFCFERMIKTTDEKMGNILNKTFLILSGVLAFWQLFSLM